MFHTKWEQDYFAKVQPISMCDPLTSVLGAVEDDELIHYSYTDCIKVAGHACPSVSTAFQLTKIALKELYGEEIPVRGNLKVRFGGDREMGANGPIGQIIQFLTGASIETGFHGLGGNYSRFNLFEYDETLNDGPGLTVEFKRIDTGEIISVQADPSMIPLTPGEQRYASYMPGVIQGTATAEEREKFYLFWHGKNRKILLEDHPGVFTVKRL